MRLSSLPPMTVSVLSETLSSVLWWNQKCVEVGELTWKGWRGAFYQNLRPPPNPE